jgi:hypothetical protein
MEDISCFPSASKACKGAKLTDPDSLCQPLAAQSSKNPLPLRSFLVNPRRSKVPRNRKSLRRFAGLQLLRSGKPSGKGLWPRSSKNRRWLNPSRPLFALSMS